MSPFSSQASVFCSTPAAQCLDIPSMLETHTGLEPARQALFH